MEQSTRTRRAALVAVGLTITAIFAVHGLWSAEESASGPTTSEARPPQELFRDWPTDRKPDLVLVLSGEEHGYLQPCGCSRPQLGGLARRYHFLQTLKDRGWPYVAVDLGDIVAHSPRRAPAAQELLKYRTSMEALDQMGYLGTALGMDEAELRLDDIAQLWALNPPHPGAVAVLGANLVEKYVDSIKSSVVSDGKNGTPRVGVVAIIGPTVAGKVLAFDPKVQFTETKHTLPGELKKLQAEKPDLLVLLYQGSAEEAKACAAKFPQFNVILHLSRESDDSDRPERVGDTLVIGVGHKGRYVGLVGVYRTKAAKQPFEFRYQLAMLGEDHETPEGKSNPIMDLMENYAKQVKERNFLSQYPQRKHPLQVGFPKAEYVGSAKCEECHPAAFDIWKESRHSHAYHSLETAKHPSQRQYDGECVACHVIGFGYQTGFVDEKKTPKLENVGCESCHGPASLHVSQPHNAEMLLLMNPYKAKADETEAQKTRRLNLIDQSCQQCHDQDNDVNWDFKKKWPGIVHHD